MITVEQLGALHLMHRATITEEHLDAMGQWKMPLSGAIEP